MQLIYFSPVPRASFAQRPHKFVEWFHKRCNAEVLWVDPYPTRFPRLSDLQRPDERKESGQYQDAAWIKVLRPAAFPIEPLPLSGILNRYLWRPLLSEIAAFADRDQTLVVVGKPSLLALAVLRRLSVVASLYDAMDDFPSFYAGLSRLAMRLRERKLVAAVTHMLVSSTVLKERWSLVRSDVQLVLNGLDECISPRSRTSVSPNQRKIFGYVGTMGAWFDWSWVAALAAFRPYDRIKLVGPMFVKPTVRLPENVEILPPCSHEQVLQLMQEFDVGLIPFKKNSLTASVDPIKYYEYRAFGLPVICTEFGEMAFRGDEDGVFLSRDLQDIESLARKALAHKSGEENIRSFVNKNTWQVRFAAINIPGYSGV